ncbi:MAG TPA: phosphoenolpyruvate synthase regulatory protein, partial [Rhodospirillales bacterium]|nr:phosphoenolpyruvate synthase regulatory protein [Rhodospirillales bacterium]
YVDPEVIAREVIFAKRLFTEQNWPVIDISRRSVEETAAGIINLLSQHQGKNIG